MKKWKLLIALVLVSGLAFAFLFIKSSLDISNAGSTATSIAKPPTIDFPDLNEEHPNQTNDNDSKLTEHELFEAELAARLQSSYGEQIQDLSVQASLMKVKINIQNHYPKDGMSHFSRVIFLAFPSHAESILSIIKRLGIYNEWLDDNQTKLDNLSPLELNGTLWQKRKELFGSDAEIIWSKDREQMMQKQVRMQDLIHRLGQANDISFDEKLYQLQTSIAETYEGTAQAIEINGGLIAQVFFGLESVQQELQQLSPEERQNQINHARRTLGYNDEQIAHLQKKDGERNKRWSNGTNYMSERKVLSNNLEGDQLEDALSVLREKYFKHEANTIRQEEESDFWRYERRRIYGRN